MLVHYRKEFQNYNFFLSPLVGLRRGLDHILAVGTDGESALVDASVPMVFTCSLLSTLAEQH